jgi:DNA-binding protein YbaB
VLEDLLVAAINDARGKSEQMMQAEMQSLTAGLNLPGGLKLPF